MNLSRRNFLGGVLALTAVAVARPAFALAPIPRIYGDGIHDDQPGLQAMFDGEPFEVDGNVVAASDGVLRGGSFILGDTLTISHEGFLVVDCRISATSDFPAAHPMIFCKAKTGAFFSCIFDVRGDGTGPGRARLLAS